MPWSDRLSSPARYAPVSSHPDPYWTYWAYWAYWAAGLLAGEVCRGAMAVEGGSDAGFTKVLPAGPASHRLVEGAALEVLGPAEKPLGPAVVPGAGLSGCRR